MTVFLILSSKMSQSTKRDNQLALSTTYHKTNLISPFICFLCYFQEYSNVARGDDTKWNYKHYHWNKG